MFTPEAHKRLVEHYRELRENDCQGAQRAAYRITVPPPRTKWTRRVPHPVLIGHAASLSQVRQLESMIRLSEALARLHCDTHIQRKYVDEARRLLKQSIIHVDSGDPPPSY
jgi:DNA replication licensing factor MCM6